MVKKFARGSVLEITFLGSVSSIEDFADPMEWEIAGILVDEDEEAMYIDSPPPENEKDPDGRFCFHTILKSSIIEIKSINKKECH